MKYALIAFLVCKESKSRIINGLVDIGFSIRGSIRDGNEYKSLVSSVEGSAVLGLEIDSNLDINNVHDSFRTLMLKLNVPYFGSILTISREDIMFDCGNMPSKKSKPDVDPLHPSNLGKVIPIKKPN